MGRPLYTTALLARLASETIPPEPPKPTYSNVEKWSRWNPFDPDSDEFFDSDNAVYEAFLIEEELAERAQDQGTRLLGDMLQGAETDSGSSSSSVTTTESDRPVTNEEGISASRPAAVQMEIDVQYSPLDGVRNERMARDTIRDDRGNEVAGLSSTSSTRRQPRRSPAVLEWRDPELSPTDAVVPRISVVPVEPVDAGLSRPPRTPSPDPLHLLSGLDRLSESPRPLIATAPSDRAVSPIPNTPARVSGVFATPPSTGSTISTSPPVSVTPRILSWGSETRSQWLSESASPTPLEMLRFLGTRMPTASTPLTY